MMRSDPKRYHRGSQVTRQWGFIRLMINSPGGLPVPEIATTLDVGIRTAYRDCEQLEAAGFQISYQPGAGRSGGKWCVAVTGLTKREGEFFRKNRPPKGGK